VIGSNGISYNPRSRKPKIDANGEKKARSPYIKVRASLLSLYREGLRADGGDGGVKLVETRRR